MPPIAAMSLEIYHPLYSHKSLEGMFTSHKHGMHFVWAHFAESLYLLQLIENS